MYVHKWTDQCDPWADEPILGKTKTKQTLTNYNEQCGWRIDYRQIGMSSRNSEMRTLVLCVIMICMRKLKNSVPSWSVMYPKLKTKTAVNICMPLPYWMSLWKSVEYWQTWTASSPHIMANACVALLLCWCFLILVLPILTLWGLPFRVPLYRITSFCSVP